MKTAAETENWRTKYFDSLTSLEREQERFRTMETSLKRLAGRLCTASLGQSSQLDEQIKKLQSVMRRDVTSAELDAITPALSDAIQALDAPPSPSPSTPNAAAAPKSAASAPASAASVPSPVAVSPVAVPPAPIVPAPVTSTAAVSPSTTAPLAGAPLVVDERVRATLAGLIAEIRRDTELSSQADAIDAQLTDSMTHVQLPEVLSSLISMVGQRIQRIERAKQEIEALLGHMVGKLDEIGQFVAEQNRNQNESHASSETLNVKLVGEMKAMGESIESVDDVIEIRSQVRRRIDSIDRHLQEFRQRETDLANAMSASNEQMRARVSELEAEATRLQTQLKDEQRLSTIDVLTKIPNRLSYDKHIDEELARWQRFKQPTCLAVWDVDHFKRINDTYGHRAGDRVLRAVADCLSKRIRTTDFLARYGGEEFVTILPGTQLSDALNVVDEMRVAIAKIGFHFRGTPVSITISSGITALVAGDSAGAAFDRADKALYQAKKNGRNCCVSG